MRYLLLLALFLLTCNKEVKCPTYGKMLPTSAASFENDISECRVVLVYVGADWCLPCREVHPFLDQKAKDLSGAVKFLYLDADSNQDKHIGLGNGYIPFFRMYIDGEMTWEGNSDVADLNKRINGALISLGFR